MAGENLDAELVLEQADLLGDAGLGGKQGIGGVRNVVAVPCHLIHIAQLLQVHAWPYIK